MTETKLSPATQLPIKDILVVASFDVEADGPNPCQNSQRGLGISLQDEFGNEIQGLDLAIRPRSDRKEDPKTMSEFWAKQPKAWEHVNAGAVPIQSAMETVATHYKLWLAAYRKVEWAAKPGSYDWMWLKCNYDQFAPPGAVPLPHKCTCISSTFNAFCDMLQIPLDTDKKQPRKRLEEVLSGQKGELSHRALDDARVQGRLLASLRQKMKNMPQTLEELPLLIPKGDLTLDEIDDEDMTFLLLGNGVSLDMDEGGDDDAEDGHDEYADNEEEQQQQHPPSSETDGLTKVESV